MRRGLICVFAIVGQLVVGLAEGQQPSPGAQAPALDKATLAQVRKLQEKRRDILREAVGMHLELYQRHLGNTAGEVANVSKRLLAAELELAATGAERIAAHERHVEVAQRLVEIALAGFQTARTNKAPLLDAQSAFLDAQVGLLKAGGKLKKDNRPPAEITPPPGRLKK